MILWEAAIDGLVTTAPNSGSLPIKDVSIYYELLDPLHIPIDCEGCSGEVISGEGGEFKIHIKSAHPRFVDSEDTQFPIRLKYSKSTFVHKNGVDKEIKHEFLCNDGVDICDAEEGSIKFLTHMQLGKKLHIYDDTSVPFSGSILYYETDFVGSPGCPVVEAEVCLMHNTSVGIEEELVCTETDGEGMYVAPVVIGSVVQTVDVVFHSHSFVKHPENKADYEKGIHIEEDGLYIGNDFVDITTSDLFVEGMFLFYLFCFYYPFRNICPLQISNDNGFNFKVAGGYCNYDLGESTIKVNIMGCEWSKEITQSEYRAVHQSLPAAVLEVQVIDVRSDNDERLEYIWSAFQDPPIIRTKDLRDISDYAEDIEKGEEEEIEGDSGTAQDSVKGDKGDPDEALDEEKTVRFQYDGILDVDMEFFTLTNSQETALVQSTECYKSFLDDDTDSFYVIDSSTIFIVRAFLNFLIIPEENKRCYEVRDDQYKVVITSNVGLDTNPGSEEYIRGLSAEERQLLSLCSNVPIKDEATGETSASGPCVVDVVMKELENSGGDIKRKAQAEYSLLTGRPNPL